MSNIKWTHELRVQMYKQVIKCFGTNSQGKKEARGKPIGMSKAKYISILNGIAIKLNLGRNKGGALSNQIAWLGCIPSIKCHKGHWNTRNKNIDAAYAAGYFKMSTVVPTMPDALTNAEPISIREIIKGWFNKVLNVFKRE